MILYTIGHSNHPIDLFINLLKIHAVKQLVDVRSTPYSRFNPQYNRKALQAGLEADGIAYIYLGEALGGRPSDPTCYKHQAVPTKPSDFQKELNYQAVMQRPWFVQGIEELLEITRRESTVILCSEENPEHCHRHHLIANYLLRTHPEVSILHIRKDGTIQDARSIPSPQSGPGAEQLTF